MRHLSVGKFGFLDLSLSLFFRKVGFPREQNYLSSSFLWKMMLELTIRWFFDATPKPVIGVHYARIYNAVFPLGKILPRQLGRSTWGKIISSVHAAMWDWTAARASTGDATAFYIQYLSRFLSAPAFRPPQSNS